MLTKSLAQRVDPNRIYWQRNTNVPETTPEENDDEEQEDDGDDSPSSSSSSGEDVGSSPSTSRRRRPAAPRPPSYASEDGVSYVIEARPRSTVVPLLGPEVIPMPVPMPMPVALAPNMMSSLPVHPSEVGRIGRAPSR